MYLQDDLQANSVALIYTHTYTYIVHIHMRELALLILPKKGKEKEVYDKFSRVKQALRLRVNNHIYAHAYYKHQDKIFLLSFFAIRDVFFLKI